jgi:tRNA(His) guanylyltransferase
MNIAAKSVMKELSSDIVMAYGDSDEYRSFISKFTNLSFLLKRDCKLYSRREFKIVSAFVSLFTSYYMFFWKEYFPTVSMKYPPSFDGRAVLYPDIQNVRDYFAWRQADCISFVKCVDKGHINNLHNTTFWALVHKGMSEQDATKRLEVLPIMTLLT